MRPRTILEQSFDNVIASRSMRGQKVVGADLTSTVLTVHSLEQVSDSAARMVAVCNKVPTMISLYPALEAAFKGRLAPIEGSFRVRDETHGRPVIAGYLSPKQDRLPKERSKEMKKVQANVFVNPSDNQIWQVDGEELVRTTQEDMDELVGLVTSSLDRRRRVPETFPVVVSSLVGPENTQYLCYLDPTSEKVDFGARIGENEVYSRKDRQVVEIASDLVIDVEQLRGMDKMPEHMADLSLEDQEKLTNYYNRVFTYNGDYLNQIERIIRSRLL